MTLHPDFREFIQLLNDHSVRYLVVGGYAVALHGHPRYTKDLDVWVEADSENIERLLSALKAFGFGSLDLNVDDFLEPDTVVQLGRPAQRIDLLTELDGVAFDNSYATRIKSIRGKRSEERVFESADARCRIFCYWGTLVRCVSHSMSYSSRRR